MANWERFPESKNFEDRTNIPGSTSAMRLRLEQLFNLLNWPQESNKSFKSPNEHKARHSRPMIPGGRDLLESIFTADDIIPQDNRYSEPDLMNSPEWFRAQRVRRLYQHLTQGNRSLRDTGDLRAPQERTSYPDKR